jgi:hypothetical protein
MSSSATKMRSSRGGGQDGNVRNREDAVQRLQRFVHWKVSFQATFHRRFVVLLVALNVRRLRHRSKAISVFSRLMKHTCDIN